jgi:hypothetical protein
MKRIIMFMLVATFLISGTARSEDYFYYDGSEQVDLTVSPTSVTVRIDYSEFTTWSSLIASDAALDESVEPFQLADSLIKLGVVSGYDIDSLVDRLLAKPAIEDACPAFIDPTDNEIYVTSRLGVIFKPSTTRAEIASITSEHGLTLVDTLFRDYRFQVLRATTTPLIQVMSIANDIYESGAAGVSVPGLILPFRLMDDPNDEYWDYQWHFKNTGQFGGTDDADIDLELARLYYMPTTPILVAVIDDGLEPHEDFAAGRIAGGYDYYFDDDDEEPYKYDAHGMATTGIIAAMSDNDKGVTSLSSYNVRVLHQRCFYQTYGTDAQGLANAIDDAVDSGAVVISNSWGRPDCIPDSYIDSALSRAHDLGVVTVFAAGNSGESHVAYPACHPLSIAVGATDSLDERWDYSQYGSDLDVMAPSADLGGTGHFWTLDQMGSDGYDDGTVDCLTQDADYLCNFGGTSAACPQVSGIAVQLMLRRPDMIGDPDRVRRIIRLSSEREQYGEDDTLRVNNYVGWGRVNADRALLAVTRGDADNNGAIDIDDIVYLCAFIFESGPAPEPHIGSGDANCSGGAPDVDVDDVVYLVTYIFQGGPEPCDCFKY